MTENAGKTMQVEEAPVVGYTGHEECMEVRHCTDPAQVWGGWGVSLGIAGFWVGTEQHHEHAGNTRKALIEYADDALDGVRFIV